MRNQDTRDPFAGAVGHAGGDEQAIHQQDRHTDYRQSCNIFLLFRMMCRTDTIATHAEPHDHCQGLHI